eukprot:TRINITY_DN5301_c0_g1_i1.p1 TRINITY_DN5301_c0_g1~~TRINITY_DN5301_c0_g1_i1.p1  ORF type:complete len:1250 (+),score=316.79 TRINITY_DN5301_c0_g1_i1:76-3825(+)
MGCGGSSGNATQADNGGTKYKADEGKKGGEAPPPKNNKKTESKAPAQEAKTPEPVQKSAPMASPPAAAAAKTAEPVSDSPALQGRDKHMPIPIMADDKDSSCLVSAYCGQSAILTVALYNAKSSETYYKTFDEAELTKTKDGLSNPPMTWPIFWKMFASAIGKGGGVKISGGGSKIDIKMKQSKGEPKEATLSLELSKDSSPYEHFIVPIPQIFKAKRKQLEDEEKEEKKDDKRLREIDLAKKEAEYNLNEAILLAGDEAEAKLTPVLAVLREKASAALSSVGEVEGEIAKTKQEIEKVESGAPNHPLDTMYNCAKPEPVELQAVDVSQLGWDTDVNKLATNYKLCDIAVALFQYHGLVEAFEMDRSIIANFYTSVEAKCHSVPYHGVLRCIDCMISMHVILEAVTKQVKFSKEDILAAFISASILDLDHEGYDNTFIKLAGSMLSMLYSDLYQNTQNHLTVAGEMFCNPHQDLLATLTPDQNKDIIETVREALFIKANVQMKQPMERLADFKSLVGGTVDWTAKDNIRHIITHAVRMCDWAAWGKPPARHQEWMKKVADEFYMQGEKELSLGLAPSVFQNTCWSTDKSLHDVNFNRGQVQFMEQAIIPLFEVMSKVGPDLEALLETAKGNKGAFEKDGGSSGNVLKNALATTPKLFGQTTNGVALCRVGPDGESLWIHHVEKGKMYHGMYNERQLEKQGVTDCARFVEDIISTFKDGTTTASNGQITLSGKSLRLEEHPAGPAGLIPYIKSYLELRGLSTMRYVDRKVEELIGQVATKGNRSLLLEGEELALNKCLEECEKSMKKLEPVLGNLKADLAKVCGGPVTVKVEIEDALAIKVRNPLKAPLPPGVTDPPNRKEVDQEILKILKSKYMTKEYGAPEDLTVLPGPEAKYCSHIMPYLTSDFCMVTKNISDPKRQRIYELVQKLDDWDYDVFDLQETMSGGISGECLRNQPDGGALFITAYALMYKWQFMQKFNIDETTLLNWISIVEAGYHPNPYHNSMHAADVLHVTHYIVGPGGCKEKVQATDEEVFAAIFAACVHDYNHPGINNAFHVRSQNYLAVLFNDRSVNENIHASSVFELMRMDKFNILKAFKGDEYRKMRDDIVDFILGTDMGLHAMILSRFKKRLETTDNKMHKLKSDKNLAITMCVKMADISNCGRPQKLYHGWCNVIVDEFFQQGDRERLQGMPVSPFMDRFTTVMAKGQIGFMNYIVMPLFECMGEFLEPMSKASIIAEENKGFWQENEDW